MTEKIIIENWTDEKMKDLLDYIHDVLVEGRISNNGTQYCYHTVWDNGISVSTFKNKKSDKFVITKVER